MGGCGRENSMGSNRFGWSPRSKKSKSNQIKSKQNRPKRNETAQCLAPPVRRDLRPVTQVRGHKGHGDPDIPDVQAVQPRASASHCVASCISLTLCCLVHQPHIVLPRASAIESDDDRRVCVVCCCMPRVGQAAKHRTGTGTGTGTHWSTGASASPAKGCGPPPWPNANRGQPHMWLRPHVRCMKCFFGSIGRRLKVFFAQCEKFLTVGESAWHWPLRKTS